MAVNLRAVATLNIKPYKASLKALAAEHAKLNGASVRGSKAVTDATSKQIAAHERLGNAVTKATRNLNTATAAAGRANRQAAVNTEAYNKALAETRNHTRRIIDSYAQMTPAMARHHRAVINLSRAQTELARQVGAGLEGPALQRYQNAVDAAAHSVGRARAAIIADNNKVAEATRKAADAQAAKNVATTKGIADARAYTQSLSGLSQEKLKLQAASERLGAAEARLASAMARSNGIITPAVSQARAGVISATAAYNKLSEAQAEVARTTGGVASGLAAQRYLYHDVSRQAAGLAIGLGAIPAAAVVVGSVWENQFANVVRTADYDIRNSTDRIDALRKSLIGMAKDMPLGFGSITEIATLGNQMGVAADELDSFTRSVAMFSATSGIAVDEAATAFGRLRTVASDANFSYMGVADSILKVGVNSVATEQEIINVTTQISSIAAQAGFTTKEMIGLSGAMASVRIPPELSRSIITRTFTQFDRAIQKNGTELQTLARVSGRTVEDIKNNWGGPGAADIFLDFTKGLQRAGRQARVELEALGITSVRDVPALLRLSNAADSTGRRGGLFEQTMTDAHTAAGEVQSQYAIMAETVVGRLKVLGNSVLSFFNTLGSSSNGFVKSAIDGLTNMFQFMEKIVDNPFSSWALGATAALSSIALLTAGVAKLAAGVKMFQHVGEIVGARSFLSAIGMTKAGGGGADMSPILAGSASLINNFKTGVKSAGVSWKNFGNTISSTASWVVADRHIKNTGLGFRTLGDSIKAGTREVPAATGLMGNLARFGLHPVTLGLAAITAVGVFAYKEWSKGFHMTSTSVEDLAQSLSSIDMSNLGEISSVLRTISISGTDVWQPWQKGFKPFADGMPGLIRDLQIYTDYQDKLASTEQRAYGAMGGNVNSQRLRNEVLAQGVDPAAFSKGLSKIDGAFKEMRDAGNGAAINAFWTNFSKGAESSSERVTMMQNALEKMPNEAEALTTQFALQGMTLDEGLANFGAYSRQIRDLAAEFDGTSIIADTFGLSDQEAADFGKAMNDAAAAFIDFNSALEAGTVTNDKGEFQSFDLGAFQKDLESSMKLQDAWMNNMRTLVSTTLEDGTTVSAEAIQALGEMGPAGKELAQSLVDGLASADPEVKAQAEKTLKAFQDAVYKSKIDFGPHLAEYKNVTEKAAAMLGKDVGDALNAELAASLTPDDWSALSTGINAVIERHGPELGGRLGKRLFENLNAGDINVDQFASLSNAFSGIGYRASKALLDELDRGISWEEINARIERIQTPKIPVEFEPDSDADRKITKAFKDMFGVRGVDVPANFSLDTTIGDLRTLLDDEFLPDIEANLSINDVIASEQFGMFRNWALAQGIDIEILANPNAAYLTLDSFKWIVEGTVTSVQLDALTELADDKLYQFILTNDGSTVAVEVDANTLEATNKVYELGGSARDPQWMPIEADTEKALEAIEEANAKAEAATTSEHTIKSNVDDVAADIDTKLQGRNTNSIHTITVNETPGTKVEANGGVLQFYANGGVRENHVAQIAPAGTMRLWAEPETGGEAYIPLAKSKRVRSEAILNDVAQRFGYALQPQNYTKFADGGQYMAQVMSRQRYSAVSVRGSDQGAKVQVGPVTFANSSQKDQFREFTRTLNRVARGL